MTGELHATVKGLVTMFYPQQWERDETFLRQPPTDVWMMRAYRELHQGYSPSLELIWIRLALMPEDERIDVWRAL